MDGGAPAGTSILPGEEGCRTTRTSINISTMHGNKSTKPKGMEMRELSLRRIRRRKKAMERGDIFSALFERPSSVGMFCVEGIRFLTFWMKSIVVRFVWKVGETAAGESKRGNGEVVSG